MGSARELAATAEKSKEAVEKLLGEALRWMQELRRQGRLELAAHEMRMRGGKAPTKGELRLRNLMASHLRYVADCIWVARAIETGVLTMEQVKRQKKKRLAKRVWWQAEERRSGDDARDERGGDQQMGEHESERKG